MNIRSKRNNIFCLSGFLIKPELIENSLNQKIDFIDYINLPEDNLSEKLTKQNDKYDLAIGFSLGACLMLKYNHLIKAKKILLVAPPANFLSNKDNPFGKDHSEMSSFISMLKEDVNLLKKKFNFSSSFPKRQLFKYLTDNNHFHEDLNKKSLLEWLFFLEFFDASIYKKCNKEIYIMHGLQDNVVSYQQTGIFKKSFKNINVKLVEDAPHALFLSHPDEFKDYVNHIINI
ncbi:MAG: hypothetical protein HOM96_00590 [Rickettsiales bacterium]|nr:hypothetical protein [Rickettsiales bacterium]